MIDRNKPSAEESCKMTIEAATKAIKLNWNCFNSYVARGKANYKLKNYKLAIEDLTRAFELKTDVPDHVYNTRGIAYFRCRSYDNAIADFTMVIKLNPEFFGAYTNRGTVFLNKGEYQLACEDMNMAISLAPEKFVVYSLRANVNVKLKKYNDAVLDIATAIELDTNDEQNYEDLEKILNEAGKCDDVGGIDFASVEKIFSIVCYFPEQEQKDCLVMLKELNKRVAAKNSSSMFCLFENRRSTNLGKEIDEYILKIDSLHKLKNERQANFDDTGSDEDNDDLRKLYQL